MDENYNDDDYISEEDLEDEENETPKTIKPKISNQSKNVDDDIEDVNDKEDDDDDYEDDDDVDADEDDEDDDDDVDDDDEEFTNNKIGVNEQVRPSFADLDNFSDDDDNEDDNDDNYLQKFDEATKQKIIADYHPELQSHNYDEIEILSRVIKDENGIIIDPLHKTLPFITRYEKARILGERTNQINAGAKIFVDIELLTYSNKEIPSDC
jgi:hypothetical protein